MTTDIAQDLDRLKRDRVIAGWQRGGGPNYGLSAAPLPWLIFPANEGPATTYYNQRDLRAAVSALQQFGPMQLSGRR